MVQDPTPRWWTFVLRGVLAVGVGIATLVVPDVSLVAFAVAFALYATVTGVLEIGGGLSMAGGPKWSLVLGGIVSIALALLAIYSPGSTALAVTLLVGIWAVAIGVAQIAAAFLLGRLRTTWPLGISGILSVAFGVFLIAVPGAGILAVLWLVAFYAFVSGITAIAFGIRLRSEGRTSPRLESEVGGSTPSPTAASH